jgi:hypothetical protein
LLEDINDIVTLTQVMDDMAFYACKKGIMDKLNRKQANELDIAIRERNEKETIPWKDFKKK